MKIRTQVIGHLFSKVVLCCIFLKGVSSLPAQIYVANYEGSTIGEYSLDGSTINASLISGGYVSYPFAIAISGTNLFVYNDGNHAIGEYTTSGATVNGLLVTGIGGAQGVRGIAVSGNDLYVADFDSSIIREYTTSGATVNASLIAGLSGPNGIAISGTNLYVANYGNGTVGEYTTSGATVNASLISGLDFPNEIAISGNDLFVGSAAGSGGIIGEYTTSGATVNASLISVTTGNEGTGIAISETNLFVANFNGTSVGEYTTSGATINTSLIAGLDFPVGIAISQELSLPVIVTQPTNQFVLTGTNVQFSVEASSSLALSYQWQFNGTNLNDRGQILGSQSNVLTVSNVQTSNSGAYSVLVSNPSGSTNSQPVTLVVYPFTNWPASALGWYQAGYTNDGFYTIAPNGLGQPTTNTLCLMSLSGGGWTELNAAIAGSLLNTDTNTLRAYLYVQSGTSLYYRTPLSQLVWNWSFGQDLDGIYYYSGARGESNFQITASSEHQAYGVGGSSGSGATYKCLIAYSSCLNPATAQVQLCQDLPGIFGGACQCGVTVYFREANQYLAPEISIQPTNQTVLPGATAQFGVTAFGNSPLHLQWQFDGTNLSDGDTIYGSQSNILTIAGITTNDAGSYQVIVTNVYGAVTSSVASLTISNLPDLAPVSVTLVGAAVAGDPVQVVAVVTNQGNGAASTTPGYWRDSVYWSTNAAFSNATFLATFNQYGTVAAGGSYSWTNSVTLPQVPSGTYYLFVDADDPTEGPVVFEVNKANNTLGVPVTVMVPDLAPVSVSALASTSSGLQVACVVTNQGPGNALGYWYDGLWVSTNAVFSETNAVNVGNVFQYHSVGSGSNYTWTTTVVVPQAGVPQYLFVVVDDPNEGDQVYELTKTNNVSSPLALATVTPDLAPVSVSAPVSTSSGLQVTCVVTNQGPGNALGNWYDGLWVSTNAVFSETNAVNVGNVFQTHNVASGSNYTWTTTVVVPQAGVPQYLFVVVDDPNEGDQVYELTKTNNVSSPLALATVTPDLAPVSVSAPVSTSSGLQVTCVVTNPGPGNALGNWYDGIWVSTNLVFSETNASFVGNVFQYHSVGSGSNYTWTTTVVVSQATVPQYLFVVVDDPNEGDQVYELTKTNNVSSPLALATVTPDLAPVSVSAPVSTSSGLQVTCVVTNQGPGNALGNWYDGIWVSTNLVFSETNASFVGNVFQYHSVGSGSNYTWTTTVVVPQAGVPQYLFVVVDDPNEGDQVYELTKTNNVSPPLALAAVTPDLAPVSVSAPASGISGTTIQMSCVVTNEGMGLASGSWYDGIYFISTISNVTNVMALGNVFQSHNVPPDGSYSWTKSVNIPQVPIGTYYLLVVVDDPNYGDQVYEVTKTNNVSAEFPFEVGSPDLAINNIIGPTNAVIAQPVQLVFTITNQGNASAFGPWQNQILLANNTNGTGAQAIAQFTFTNILAPGDFATITQTVILPTTIAGTRYFGLFADSADQVPELNKSNNIAYATSPVFITGADLDMEQLNVPASAQFGQAFTVTFAVTNIGGASATANWDDQIYLSPSSNSISGATLLATVPGVSPLAPGGGYINTQSVSVPLTSGSTPGTFYIVTMANANNGQLELTMTNNQLVTPVAITLPPLPDLIVGQVTSPATAIAGQTVPVSWAVTNIGNANVIGPWQEAVYLLPTNATLAQFTTDANAYVSLGTFVFTNDLASGESIARTQEVQIPATGLAGELQMGVYVNSAKTVVEQSETNNAAFALNQMNVPMALSLYVLFTNVLETTSIPNIPCLVSRNGDLTQPVNVSLASLPAINLAVPPSVTIPAGVASAPFSATVVNNGVPGPNVLALITANANNYLGATSQVTIVNDNVPGLIVSLASDEVTMGQSVTATVTSTTTNSDSVTVAITSSSSTTLTVPVSVTIPAGSNSVTFTVTAVQSSVLAPPQNYVVSASASGYTGSSANLTVLNDNTPTLTLLLNTTNINEADGPFDAIGTVSYQPVSSQPLTIALTSTNPGAAVVPAQITIPALTGSATFSVAAVNDTNITGPKLTLISAQALDIQGDPVGSPASEALTVQDNNGPVLRVSIANPVVPKGANPATAGTVWTATPPTNDLTVLLTSSDTNEAMVPSTVTIPSGQTNATFEIVSVDDGIPLTSQTLSITASATNYASGSSVLTVSDLILPDLVVQDITVPSAVYSDQPLTIGFRLNNQGLGALTNGVTQYVYLTTNAVSESYILVATSFSAGPLAPGQSVSESVVVPGSALPISGSYWVVVTANANNTAQEITEANNSAASASPVVISPEYSATVQTSVTNVLMGTPIPLFGSATLTAGGPATNVPVNIIVTVRGLQRIVSATTDANGNFYTVFAPLSNEAGTYTIAAVFPGITTAAPQGQFNILGMSANPSSEGLNINSGAIGSSSIGINNLSDVPLTNLTATINGLAANLTGSATLSANYLAGQGASTLSISITANDSSIQQSSFTVQIMSAEGAVLNIPVSVTVNPPEPQLVVSPSQLRTSMLVGGQSVVQFELVNDGGAATGPLAFALPSVPWMAISSANPMPSIDPGASNLVTLILTPSTNLALGPYTGTIAINGTGMSTQVPFSFDAVSDAHGSLLIQSVDELTFFATNSPPLTNASVTLTDPFSGEIVASGVTDTNGLFFAPGLLAGAYSLVVTAPQHSSFNGEAVVTAGETNTIQAFLSLQTVTYTWTVVPTQVQVQNQITVQATFQTDVPAPVIVATPASLDLSSLTQPGQYLDVPLTLANQGLIGVQNVAIALNSSDLYEFQIVTTNIGNLAAKSTVTIPMRVTFLGNSSAAASAISKNVGSGSGGTARADSIVPCIPYIGYAFSYLCGPYGVNSSVQLPVFNALSDCGSSSSPGGGTVVNITGSGGGYGAGYGNGSGTWSGPRTISTPDLCDPCLWKQVGAAASCVIGFVDIPNEVAQCLREAKECADGVNDNCFKSPNITCAVSMGSCVCSFLTRSGKLGEEFAKRVDWIAWGLTAIQCTHDINTACDESSSANSSFENDVISSSGQAYVTTLDSQANDIQTEINPCIYFLGTPGWFDVTDTNALAVLLDQFFNDTQTNADGTPFITSDERNALHALTLPPPLMPSDLDAFLDRWNLTMSNYSQGVFSVGQVPSGGNTNFIDFSQWTNMVNSALQVLQNYQSEGFTDPGAAWATTKSAFLESAQGSSGTCAQVTIQLDQTAVLTLNAFHATLQLNNNGEDLLTNILVSVVVQNQTGDDVTSLFNIQAPALAGGLSAVDGTGFLPPGQSGSAQWTLIPRAAAAPQTATNYLVSGTFSYVENGLTVTIPLTPEPITVQPSPQMYLDYFLQQDVYGDDPFTPEIEPSIPFAMGLLVKNQGYGTANNFQITSAQPTIVDNEKGLDIAFQIIGTQVDGQPASPSLTANFGNLLPNQIGVGVWYMTSTLDGQFTGINATYKAIDPLGNPTVSIIDGIQTHIMTHLVQAAGSWDDGLPDFLVDDVPNSQSLPDTVYLSSGQIEPVSTVQSGSTSGPVTANNLQVQFTANFPAGFTYILVPDPANGLFGLTNIVCSDGTSLLTNDFWITYQTFQGLTQPPLLQTNLHLFVYHTNAGPDTYTLDYGAPVSLINTNPPVSSVFSLPAKSPTTFGVAWSGEPYAGGAAIAYYDIYVSDDSGPFTDWQSKTTANGALFYGTNGHAYAFYSVATDTAGHREAAPLQPQAETTVGVFTNPPTISIVPSVTLDAGQTLSLGVTASDPNPESVLTFSLGIGAPNGASVNPNTGQITWPTSPLYGGTTNIINVIVSDNSQPPLTATGTVSVILLTVANPPVLAAISNYRIYVAQTLTITNYAVDENIPPRPLTFSLGADAPTNATINPTNGIFQWQPTQAQGRTTNVISVVVTDNGNPPLSATQQFTVIVRPVSYQWALNLGTTGVVVGATSSVPVTLQSALPLTDITAVVQVPATLLTNFALLPTSPEILSTGIQPLGSNEYTINLSLNPSLNSGGSSTVAQLGFVAVPQTNSAIVSLGLSQLSGLQENGQIAPQPGAFGGKVFIIGSQPLLNAWLATNALRMLTLYGIPGASYEVQYSTNLLGANSWQLAWLVPMTNVSDVFDANASLPQVFYRAFQFSANPPLLKLNSFAPTNMVLLLYGQNGSNYMIMSGTNFLSKANWTSVAGFTLTNSFQFINAGAATNSSQFFRAIRH